ncbi:MAG: aldose 1-epimerase family protein [Flavihumibacter sp.]|nr:aldose 1-epimerase family protein [Flavihumibacter sp.]
MPIIVLENDVLKVAVHTKGAELQSVFNQQTGLEYMWSGDPAYWGKFSPVLFPIVGTLKNDTYYYNHQSYQLPRHGFARDMDFEVQHKEQAAASFSITATAETLKKFPFPFQLLLHYSLVKNTLRVEYEVRNNGSSNMYFSIGAHPAFCVPLTADTVYSDYRLEFNKQETAGRWPISKEGLIEATPTPLLQQTNTLPLQKELFHKDAIVLKGLQSDCIQLCADKTIHGWQFDYTDFPFMGIWAAKDAHFVCIEPWCGIADSVTATQQLTEKEGIHCLASGEVFKRHWSLSTR